MKAILITKEVAGMLRVSEDYVRGLIKQKRLKAYKEGGRGGYRISLDEVKKYVQAKENEYLLSTDFKNVG